MESDSIGFQVLGPVRDVEVIASGRGIRGLSLLVKRYGKGRWRKLKGVAAVRLQTGRIRLTEIHWYEAHGIGKRDVKRKRYLDVL